MPAEPLLKYQTSAAHKRGCDARPQWGLWLFLCFALLPFVGFLISWATSFGIYAADRKPLTFLDRILLWSWLLFSILGLALIFWRVWEAGKMHESPDTDDAVTSAPHKCNTSEPL